MLSGIQSRIQFPTRNAPSGVQTVTDTRDFLLPRIGVSIHQVAESNDFIASFDPIYVKPTYPKTIYLFLRHPGRISILAALHAWSKDEERSWLKSEKFVVERVALLLIIILIGTQNSALVCALLWCFCIGEDTTF